MSHVDFWKMPMSRVTIWHVDFKEGPCRTLNVRNTLCHVVYIYSPVTRPYVACQFVEMAIRHVDFKGAVVLKP